MTASDTLVAVRLSDGWKLLSAATGSLDEVAALPVPAAAVVRRDHLGRWWSLDDASHVVEGFAWEDGALRRHCRHGLPTTFEARDVAGDAHRLFVGGLFSHEEYLSENYGPALLAASIVGDAVWKRLEIGCEYNRLSDKAIDGIAVVGDELLGVDDVVWPKFIERYDLLQDPPKRTGSVSMPPGVNEKTEPGVAFNDQWLAVRSHAVYMHGVSRSVTLYRLPDLRPTARFGAPRRGSDVPDEWRRFVDGHRCFNAAFLGTRLVVACGDEGLACVDCEGVEPLPPRTVERTVQRWNPMTKSIDPPQQITEVVRPLLSLDQRARWIPCSEGARTVDVIAVPSREGVVVVEEHGDTRTARWVPIVGGTGL